MLTIGDCIGLSELTEEEVLAIADHEHIPEIAAVELGNYLLHTANGERRIRRMIVEDIAEARRRRDLKRTATLKMVLKHFVEEHAEAA